MSFMLKIAFALQVTVAGAVGLGTSTSTSTATSAATSAATPAAIEQGASGPVLNRASCDVCYEIYDSCLAEGTPPAGCQRLAANCFRTCIP